METIKKKLNALKVERDAAVEEKETAEAEKKEALDKAEAVSKIIVFGTESGEYSANKIFYGFL